MQLSLDTLEHMHLNRQSAALLLPLLPARKLGVLGLFRVSMAAFGENRFFARIPVQEGTLEQDATTSRIGLE
jgi:hypothetical protein